MAALTRQHTMQRLSHMNDKNKTHFLPNGMKFPQINSPIARKPAFHRQKVEQPESLAGSGFQNSVKFSADSRFR